MEFITEDIRMSITEVARQIGYLIIDTNEKGEYNLVKKLTIENYPRFHIYLKQAGNKLFFSLHLDQKKPSYEGSHAHNGEYDGPLVEAEAERVEEVLDDED